MEQKQGESSSNATNIANEDRNLCRASDEAEKAMLDSDSDNRTLASNILKQIEAAKNK